MKLRNKQTGETENKNTPLVNSPSQLASSSSQNPKHGLKKVNGKQQKQVEEEEVATAALVGVPSFLIKTYDIVNVRRTKEVILCLGPVIGQYYLLE
jgi:hypothetical protein